jgi:CheY-like chemotaxis protein/HPt (histidine-containing phosphotransfer) domain-containing protein
LVSNAVKFTYQGQVIISASSSTVIPGKRVILDVSVRDSGIGIPEHKLSHLFQEFSQVDASTTRRFGGTGLGLAISKKLVEIMGGSISVESVEGEGSIFRFSIPYEVNLFSRKRLRMPTSLAAPKVWIAAANRDSEQIIEVVAQSAGFIPRRGDTPEQTAKHILEEQPGLAIIDSELCDKYSVLMEAVRDAAATFFILLHPLGKPLTFPWLPRRYVVVGAPYKHRKIAEILLKQMNVEPEATGDTTDDLLIIGHEDARILVAEDNVVNQKIIAAMLQKMGVRADLAINGLEALEAAKTKHYHIIFMDMQMPVMDGLESTRKIREAASHPLPTTIIALTANALETHRRECIEAGMNFFLAKPITLKKLRESISQALDMQEKQFSNPVHEQAPHDAIHINHETLSELKLLDKDGSSDFFTGLIHSFSERSELLVRDIIQAAQNEETHNLRHLAHALKGSALGVGAEGVAEIARELELRMEHGNLSGLSDLVSRLSAVHRDTLVALENVVADVQPPNHQGDEIWL